MHSVQHVLPESAPCMYPEQIESGPQRMRKSTLNHAFSYSSTDLLSNFYMADAALVVRISRSSEHQLWNHTVPILMQPWEKMTLELGTRTPPSWKDVSVGLGLWVRGDLQQEQTVAVPLPPGHRSIGLGCGHRGPGQLGSGHHPRESQLNFWYCLALTCLSSTSWAKAEPYM